VYYKFYIYHSDHFFRGLLSARNVSISVYLYLAYFNIFTHESLDNFM